MLLVLVAHLELLTLKIAQRNISMPFETNIPLVTQRPYYAFGLISIMKMARFKIGHNPGTTRGKTQLQHALLLHFLFIKILLIIIAFLDRIFLVPLRETHTHYFTCHFHFCLYIRFQGGNSQGPECRPVYSDDTGYAYGNYGNACDTLGWVQHDEPGNVSQDVWKYAPNVPYYMRLTKVQNSSGPLYC